MDSSRSNQSEFSGRVKGVKVDAVDTTGAGDAFVAGILSQLAKDLSLLQNEDRLKEVLKFANALWRINCEGERCHSSFANQRSCEQCHNSACWIEFL
ncbi:hypothetical protein OIU84_014525 [Salix udensis]|uniref:Carbohydrate kinase PfkB domain-containing protein n=1 Tax=Salix udensis TaxID=889485 RepID=A0AAD6NS34_9ROSI|nr:hypothetical protein OIU84_014525 [Salix udensis]